MQVKKQLLEPDMEQQTGLKLEKEYVKAVPKTTLPLLPCSIHHQKHPQNFISAGLQDK